MHPISIAAEPVFTLWGIAITNTLLTTWIVMAIVLLFAFLIGRSVRLVPRNNTQNLTEVIIGGIYDQMESLLGCAKETKKFFGLIATIFIFVLINNWFGLIPGVTAVQIEPGVAHSESAEISHVNEVSSHATAAETAEEAHHTVPLMRAASSDLSFTLALALIAFFYIQFMGLSYLGFRYLGKFLNFKSPVGFFVGILELISELAKILSFSFRLFGNIFAGEVVLVVMTFLVPFILPAPFYGIEIFVGLIQAAVFAGLTLAFIKTAITVHH